jgi:manganese efflux pump family protein
VDHLIAGHFTELPGAVSVIKGRSGHTPPERHLPLALVITHGVMATITVALVLLTALDVFGS